MECDKCKIKTCDFCGKEIPQGHVNFTTITHNEGSNENGEKRNMCYNCEAMLRHQKKVA